MAGGIPLKKAGVSRAGIPAARTTAYQQSSNRRGPSPRLILPK